MTLEQTRARIAVIKRRRRRATAACAALAVLALAAGAWAASRIMPFYGKWQYENRRESHLLAAIDEPSYLVATIVYENEPPSGIMLEDMDAGIRLRDMDISDDPSSNTVTITCDVGPDSLPGNFSVSLVPADNYELKYAVEIQPSYKYMDAGVEFARDADGNLWVRVSAAYSRCVDERGLRVMIHLQGRSYAPLAYDGWIAQDGGPKPIEVNLTETCLWRKHDLSKVASIEVVVTGEHWNPDETEMSSVNFKKAMPIKEWPLYDPDQTLFAFSMGDTDEYLSSLHLQPPEGREPYPTERPAGQQDAETEDASDAQETDGN